MSASGEWLRGHWFVAARSAAVNQKPIKVMLFGSPVVLVRTRDAAVMALEDRCPHRGIALSRGKLSALGLECAYHGWAFGADGRCTAMPGALDNKPVAEVRVPAYRTLERDGFVWVSPRGEMPFPERVLALRPEQRRFIWQSTWSTPILEAQENVLDALHTHSVHQGLLRDPRRRREMQVTVRKTSDGFVVDYTGHAAQTGWVYRLFESRRSSERAFFSGLSTAQLEYRYANGRTVWITVNFTPASPRSTHVFGTLHAAGRATPTWFIKLIVWPFLRRVAHQDQAILERQEADVSSFPERHPVVTRLDVVRPYLQAAWDDRVDRVADDLSISLYL